MRVLDAVREHCAAVAESARHVRIDLDRAALEPGVAGLDPAVHFLDGPPEEVTRYVLTLDATNFGSGWFEALGVDTDVLTRRLTACFRSGAPIDFGLPPDHALTRLYAEALGQLDAWRAAHPVLPGTAEGLATALTEMPFFRDPGFYKRAQITANDLALAGVVDFPDVDRLTIFADNLVPHVLRHDGVLVYDDELAARIAAGEELPHGSRMEVELRACALHACEALAARAGVPPRTLDNWLWNRGMEIGGLAHITKTTAY
jgi:hypothetical protein